MDIIATVYIDDQDSTNVGWAWRCTVDGHTESGPADSADDGILQAAACAPEGAVPLDLAAWTYHDGGVGSYRFES